MNTNITNLNTSEIADINDPEVAVVNSEIRRIIDIDLHTFISDLDTLSAALYADDPYRCENLIQTAPNEDIFGAACFAMEMLNEPFLRDEMAFNGFFSMMASNLLEIAKSCDVYGARLARILLLFCLKSELYCIEPEIDEALYVFLKKFKDEHHYTIMPVPELFLSEEHLAELSQQETFNDVNNEPDGMEVF